MMDICCHLSADRIVVLSWHCFQVNCPVTGLVEDADWVVIRSIYRCVAAAGQ
jgi:transposase